MVDDDYDAILADFDVDQAIAERQREDLQVNRKSVKDRHPPSVNDSFDYGPLHGEQDTISRQSGRGNGFR